MDDLFSGYLTPPTTTVKQVVESNLTAHKNTLHRQKRQICRLAELALWNVRNRGRVLPPRIYALGYPFCGSQKRSNLSISKCFSLAGIIGIMGTKSEDKETKPGEEKIVEMIKMSKLCHSRAEFKKSEQLLHLALRMAYEIQHHDAQRYIIDDMANNAYETGDLKKAEKLFIDTMKHLIASGVPQDDNSVIHISGKLANLYAMFDDVDKANEGFLFCIQNLETKLEKGVNDFDTQALYTLILSWFGQFLHNKGDFVQSLNMFEKSLEVSVKINGEHHPHSLLQLNNMAATFTLMNRLQDALRCLNKALTLAQEHQMDDGVGDLPYYYINVANIYLTQVEKASADSGELLRLAASSCRNALKWAKLVDDREALKQAKKCWKKIENYQIAQ
uniref:EOG090X06TI n=1 Tax=Scapholeberis mucronata TaxID=202097 RepID=A0A4Y7NK66_9CRUS|nr:EOG090X06TI [Scapholeberis mucronata]SVE93638.1 EOG090X06TI [Scapholeberis mucronata]